MLACPMPETMPGGRGAYPGAVDMIQHDFLIKDFRVVCLLFFDDRIFFDVPLGQVSCGCDEVGWTTLVHGRLRYWVILLFVRHPAACGGWTLE